MVTPDLENPFSPPKRRNPDNAELVGKILGKHQEAAMREILGTPNPLPEDDLLVADLTDEEREAIEKEKRERPWTRAQYIKWADGFGGEARVDSHSTCHPDGMATVQDWRAIILPRNELTEFPRGLDATGSLYLNDNKINSLKGFPLVVNGTLSLESNNITSLEGIPKYVTYGTGLSGNKIVSLEGLPEVSNDLWLDHNPITSLEYLPKTINGDLRLWNIPATSIPSGLKIDGKIYMKSEQTELIKDAQNKGYRVQVLP